MNYITDTSTNGDTGFVIIAIFIVFLIFIAFFINSYLPFKEDMDYIKAEMARSHGKEEYLYWKRELKMLYMSKIPIVRSFVRQKRSR